jgi:dihydrofolate synthase/folylpolyglutamate synthase
MNALSGDAGTVVSAPAKDELDRYFVAAARLDALIDPAGPADRSLAAVTARAAAKLERARAFLGFLGNPQDTFPIVHVTGTSGKGSTCAAIASILTHAGYRVGLATSPYLQVATEKVQIGERLIAPGAFAALVDELLEAAESWSRRARLNRPVSYGEVWTALMATWFARERVDLAVVEVGAGGRFDVTNLVRPLVTVVTSVGLDHTGTLGPTIEQIAWHKAGIFKPTAAAVTAAADPTALAVLRGEAESLGVALTEIDPERSVRVLESSSAGAVWHLVDAKGRPQSPLLRTNVPGRYQAVNGATALTVVRLLDAHGFAVPDRAVESGLSAARLPGRGERMPVVAGPGVLVDVAHNPDKVRALVSSLPHEFKDEGGVAARPVLLTGALASKDVRAMLEIVTPVASAVVTTSVGVTGKHPLAAEAMARLATETGFGGPVIAEPDPVRALETALRWAHELGVPVLATGSLFLAGRVREHWYRGEDILRQRTPWPAPGSEIG